MRDTSKVAALDHAMHAAHTWVNEIAREFHPDDDSVGAPPFRHIRSSRQRDASVGDASPDSSRSWRPWL